MGVLLSFVFANPLVSAIVILIVVIIIFTSKKAVVFSIGSFKIDIGSKPKTVVKEKASTKMRGMISADTRTRVKVVMDLRDELRKRQLKAFENTFVRIKTDLNDKYANWLSERIKCDDIRKNIEFVLVTDKISRCIYERVLPGINEVLTQNHIAEKTEIEWRQHKMTTLRTIKADVFRFLEAEYLGGYTVNRDEQYKFFVREWMDIEHEILTTFDTARDLAILTDQEIQNVKSKYDNRIYNEDYF